MLMCQLSEMNGTMIVGRLLIVALVQREERMAGPKDRYSQTRHDAMAHRMPMYPLGAPHMVRQLLYCQAPSAMIQPQYGLTTNSIHNYIRISTIMAWLIGFYGGKGRGNFEFEGSHLVMMACTFLVSMCVLSMVIIACARRSKLLIRNLAARNNLRAIVLYWR